MNRPWSNFFGINDVEKDTELTLDKDDIENAQMSRKGMKDMHFCKSCPVWEELIFVKCKYCNSSILPRSIKNHVEVRHTGIRQYEKDPESSIFLKVEKKPSLPTILSSTSIPRASTTTSRIHGPRARTSCSGDVFSVANQSPQMAEQFLGWPNSPHGAYQQSPLNMATNPKTDNSKMKVVIMPGYSGKVGMGVSLLTKNHKNQLELSASIPVVNPPPYNQTFSFSSCPDVVPPASTFASPRDMPSTSSYKKLRTPSREMPSTSSRDSPSSYDMPSTSKGLSLCRPLFPNKTGFVESAMYNSVLQPPYAASSLGDPQQRTPKLVLRRVSPTDSNSQAEGRQYDQGLEGISKNRKDSPVTYFTVVKGKDFNKTFAVDDKIRKKANKRAKEKCVNRKLKVLENQRAKLIAQLFQELQSVKEKLDQCNRSKQQIERELSAVKADLEETKRTTDSRNEALQKQNAKFEDEIQKLKLLNETLTNSLEQAQYFSQRLGNVWNITDDQLSKRFQTIEEQKVELQRRIEELEYESRELKNSSVIERRQFDVKLRQYCKIMEELKKRYDAQVAKSQELRLQRNLYERYLSPKIRCQVKDLASSTVHEVYPGLLTPQPTPPIASPNVPLAVETQNENDFSIQSPLSSESSDEFPQEESQSQQEVSQDEEVS